MRPSSAILAAGLLGAVAAPPALPRAAADPAPRAVLAQAQAPSQAPSQAPVPAASPAPAGDPVVARIDGEALRLSDVDRAAANLPEELRQAPRQVIVPLLVDQLVSQRALVLAARKAGLDRDEAVRDAMRRAEEQALQQAYLEREVGTKVDEAALRRRYEAQVAGRAPEEEVHARHVLTQTESDARSALAEIRGGTDFAEVARRRSSGPGTQQGGDLGFFKKGDMVAEFADAAFALQPGQVSAEPVRTPFGWHVIRVEERRRAAPPAFEEAREELRQAAVQEEVAALVGRAREQARIERFALDGSPLPAAPAQPAR